MSLGALLDLVPGFVISWSLMGASESDSVFRIEGTAPVARVYQLKIHLHESCPSRPSHRENYNEVELGELFTLLCCQRTHHSQFFSRLGDQNWGKEWKRSSCCFSGPGKKAWARLSHHLGGGSNGKNKQENAGSIPPIGQAANRPHDSVARQEEIEHLAIKLLVIPPAFM